MIIRKFNSDKKPFEMFQQVYSGEHSVFLDSGMNDTGMGKYSIIATNPFKIFKGYRNGYKVDENFLEGDILKALQALLNQYNVNYESELPFIGGAIGYLSYDLKDEIETLVWDAEEDIEIPLIYFAFYHGAMVFDHDNGSWYLTDADIDGKGNERIDEYISLIESSHKELSLKGSTLPMVFDENMTKPYYLETIERIKKYIWSGDIYQANMTQRFSVDYNGDSMYLYNILRDLNPAPFASYFEFGEGTVISSSPERFVEKRGNRLVTRPIKGTVARGLTEEEDLINRQWLKDSEKDQSELLMIVDLERNDLGRIAKVGTVNVSELFKLETYATVHHLVATVECEVEDELTFESFVRATFPGGSITGAPKIRAMEVIEELEPTKRNLYTGSIGYLDFNGDFDLNIVIRTILRVDDRLHYQVGGGIVWDSDGESEYQESLTKGLALRKAILESRC